MGGGAISAPFAPASGNRCGHDPRAPRAFTPPQHYKRRPKAVRTTIDRLLRFFERPLETFPTLGKGMHRLRIMRSELREACVAVLGALVYCTDAETFRVIAESAGPGEPVSGVSVAELAAMAGVSVRRAERALTWLYRAGMVGSSRQYERDGERYIGLPAIRTLNRGIFQVLGTWDLWVKLARKRYRERTGAAPPTSQTTQRERGHAKIQWRSVKQALGSTLQKGRRDHDPPDTS